MPTQKQLDDLTYIEVHVYNRDDTYLELGKYVEADVINLTIHENITNGEASTMQVNFVQFIDAVMRLVMVASPMEAPDAA